MTRIYFTATLFGAIASGVGYAELVAALAFEVATVKPTGTSFAGDIVGKPEPGRLPTADELKTMLRLDSRKVPVQSLIVDHAERPAGN
jgi:hypothetical protein